MSTTEIMLMLSSLNVSRWKYRHGKSCLFPMPGVWIGKERSAIISHSIIHVGV